MKLQVLSDLHNEFLRTGKRVASHRWKGEIPASDADVVVLAGDIDTGLCGVEWMLKEAARLGKPIVYVLGNHEFYGHEYFFLKQAISDQCKHTDVHLLDAGCFELNNVRILGVTLWTDYAGDINIPGDLAMHYAQQNLADHQVIAYKPAAQCLEFKPPHALVLHEKEKHWLISQLTKPYRGKTVVVSHHAPHWVCNHPGFPNSPLGPAFYSNLDALFLAHDIDLWIYGHTHANLDTVIGKTRVVSNQAGYPGEDVKGFDPGFLVEV